MTNSIFSFLLHYIISYVASTRFKAADKGIMDALVHQRKKRGAGGAGGRGEATAGESVLGTPLWGMLYADDAGVVSRSPEQLKKMMEVIVVVCAAFGITVSESKTAIMCLRAKGMPESTELFNDWGGRGYDDSVPEEVTKTAPSGVRAT